MSFPGFSCLLGIMVYWIGVVYFHNLFAVFSDFVIPIKIIGMQIIIA